MSDDVSKTSAIASARARLHEAGQEHLVDHAETLPPETAAAFLTAAAEWPWAELRHAIDHPVEGVPPVLRPPVALTWKRQSGEGGLRRRLAGIGRGLLAGGRVATLLLAGGQGTRLGHAGPKGTFVFGPEPDRSLYRLLMERVAAASRRAGRAVPIYVLVSRSTEAATRAALADPVAFGLEPDQIGFILQGELPALDAQGRGLIAEPGALALAPDGHGGALAAVQAAGVIDHLVERGVDVLTTFQVDNPLGRPVDPVMLGWMVERKLQVVTKAVAKATPDERVGVYARDLEGRHRIVEYSEIPDGGLPDGIDLGSIAIHGFSVRFLKDLQDRGYELPLHRARKAVAHLDAAGQRVEPGSPNAWKLERFIFDVFPEAKRLEVHEVKREREFAPVKNAKGADSPVTARLLVDAEVRRVSAAAGEPLPDPVGLHPLDLPELD